MYKTVINLNTLFDKCNTFMDELDLNMRDFSTDVKGTYSWKKSDNQYSLFLDLPGYEKSEITLYHEDKYLLVEANNTVRGKYNLKISIPKVLDVSSIKSTLKNGVLSIVGNTITQSKTKSTIDIE